MNMRAGINLSKEMNRLMKRSRKYGYKRPTYYNSNYKEEFDCEDIDDSDCCGIKEKLMDVDYKSIACTVAVLGTTMLAGYFIGKATNRNTRFSLF